MPNVSSNIARNTGLYMYIGNTKCMQQHMDSKKCLALSLSLSFFLYMYISHFNTIYLLIEKCGLILAQKHLCVVTEKTFFYHRFTVKYIYIFRVECELCVLRGKKTWPHRYSKKRWKYSKWLYYDMEKSFEIQKCLPFRQGP